MLTQNVREWQGMARGYWKERRKEIGRKLCNEAWSDHVQAVDRAVGIPLGETTRKAGRAAYLAWVGLTDAEKRSVLQDMYPDAWAPKPRVNRGTGKAEETDDAEATDAE